MSGAETAFGNYAPAYDFVFTHSRTGMLQRKRVWNFLRKNISAAEYPALLELNCGTGEDARWLSQQGFRVTATDISEEMIRMGKQKGDSAGNNITFLRADLREIDSAITKQKFNVVFSNFGGMNCQSPAELSSLAGNLKRILLPGGKFIAVVMGRNCRWEQFYFKRKNNPATAFRRREKGSVNAVVGGTNFPVWYYSPNEFLNFFNPHFRIKKIKPIGIALPPSYLENYFHAKPLLLHLLNFAENILGNFSSLSDKADHYIIELELLNTPDNSNA